MSVLLLPAHSATESADVVVARQLTRGFGLRADRERRKFLDRFSRYQKYGTIHIFSIAAPEVIAQEIDVAIRAAMGAIPQYG